MRKKILHIIPSASIGGIESLVVSILENVDKSKFQFDFAVFNPNNPIHKKNMENLGANVYFISNAKSKNSFFSKFSWRFKAIINYIKLLNRNEYDAVHCHISNGYGLYILIAKIKKIPIRIVHAHNAGSVRKIKFSILFRKIKSFISFEWLITDKIGCSQAAADCIFGKDSIKDEKVKIIYNGIDIKKFSPVSLKEKEKNQKKYDININNINFIHIGRFCYEKNHLFLLEVFSQMLKKRDDLVLNIIGYGELENEILEKIKNLNIEKSVNILKPDTNISEFLSVMDFFLLPSWSEGFPITALESQVNGVPIFISDRITREVDMGIAIYLPLNEGAIYWSNSILDLIENETYPKKINNNKLKEFDIINTTKQIVELYHKTTN